MKYALTIVALCLAACTADADRLRLLASLVGQPETELVRQMGVPSRTYEVGAQKFMAYDDRHQTAFFTGGPFLGYGYGYGYGYIGAGAFGFPAEVIERRCETTFEISAGRVLSWVNRGNACP